ncbi:DinB family protein [Gracilibacillus alcaliphilus]|uniref:DinB family protein n=1 Tax=Gracilibacillus alcaliphilus TaxID=1401441 RepID=UPI00195D0B14|nr:DinB family protein [Gracilibacillus alcaliphilus]MBM7677880.1 putative damage-inducible protein DinB [Gracilibacillus alcaliphilus]
MAAKKEIRILKTMADEVEALKQVEEEQLCEPIQADKWSIREIVAHLYYWDKFNLENMVPFMQDEAKLQAFPDHDTHNREGLEKVKDVSVYEIIDQFLVTRLQLCTALEEVDSKNRFTIGSGKRKFGADSFIRIFQKHDKHHLEQIQKKLG